MRRNRLVLVAAVVTALLTGCSGGSDSPGSDRPDGDLYVAMGDSYASGPGLGQPDPDAPSCQRSLDNYAHLAAEKLPSLTLVDVSCGMATTEDVTGSQTTSQGEALDPQIDAVTPAAKLVTITVGGGDGNAAGGLFLYCLLPNSATDQKCREFADSYMPTVYPKIREQVSAVLDQIQQEAPEAKILLVGYLRIAPDQGKCDVLPLSAARRASVEKFDTSLNSTLRDAAEQADVTFVDMLEASQGHDACAGDEAWVRGITNVAGDGAFLHPTADGMRAMAARVLDAFPH